MYKYKLDEYRLENLKVNRLHVLKILRRYKNGWFSAENAASDMLDIRHRFILPWMSTREYWEDQHPYMTLSNRIVYIATTLMGRKWVENYTKNQGVTARL